MLENGAGSSQPYIYLFFHWQPTKQQLHPDDSHVNIIAYSTLPYLQHLVDHGSLLPILG
jgi:hypothetical protein